jgi:hypothetical protein
MEASNENVEEFILNKIQIFIDEIFTNMLIIEKNNHKQIHIPDEECHKDSKYIIIDYLIYQGFSFSMKSSDYNYTRQFQLQNLEVINI